MVLRAFVLALASLAISATAAFAQAPAPALSDAFALRGIEVDRTAPTAAQAREQAIAEGQRLAWRRLVERLVPIAARSGLEAIPAAEIVPLIDSFGVETERGSGTRWLGSLAYRFKAEGVRRLFRSRNVPFAETLARPVVIVPVLVRDGQAALWEDDNAWRLAWANLPPSAGLQPWSVPKADLDDAGLIGAEQAAAADRAGLRALSAHYRTQGAIVVLADYAAGGTAVQIRVARVGAPAPDADWQLDVPLNAGEAVDDAWPRLARLAADAIEERWKAEVLVEGGEITSLRATVPVSDIAEWVTLRRRLGEVATVKRMEVLVLGRGGAIVELRHEGGEEALRTALAQRDLSLLADEGGWRLQLAERAGRP
ncbi:MAG: DUF2066 domain-containing protein [Rhodospirillales bacterium]|nr:DUF2066 domain-containing protein [Rhodospirillales bacterium]